MKLPEVLKLAIEEETGRLSKTALHSAAQEMSQRYRDPNQREAILKNKERFLSTDAQRMAYILARMPATFGAIRYTLNELKPHFSSVFNSILDIGSGPGTVMWAVSEVFPHATEIRMLEQDAFLIALGKKLALKSDRLFIKQAKWIQNDIFKWQEIPESDLITISYAMGEWRQAAWSDMIKKLWSKARYAMLIVEPGTMLGFSVIRQVRQQLIDLGAYMVAPCPHTLACPMPENDWCHFNVRIERSRAHRHVKEGSLGYEDEKFSYVAVAKTSVDLPQARILRHPIKHKGHTSFVLCTKDNGIMNKIISRRDGELYKKARDLEWGDIL